MPAPYSDLLRKAADIADERNDEYGEASANFRRIQETLKTSLGLELTLPELCKVMVATKLGRNLHLHKEDNILDAINYLAMMQYFISQKEL